MARTISWQHLDFHSSSASCLSRCSTQIIAPRQVYLCEWDLLLCRRNSCAICLIQCLIRCLSALSLPKIVLQKAFTVIGKWMSFSAAISFLWTDRVESRCKTGNPSSESHAAVAHRGLWSAKSFKIVMSWTSIKGSAQEWKSIILDPWAWVIL